LSFKSTEDINKKMIRLKILVNAQKKIAIWASSHFVNLAMFNTLLVILVLLHSAKYFNPFWTISINVIVLVSLIASVFLLGARSRSLFIVSLLFWFFAGGIRILGINVWAERISIYTFQSFFIGVLLFFIEAVNIFSKKE